MSSLFSSSLEQISTCAQSISELPFHGPKAFTNAILNTSDITRLIRDTEIHERALYQLASPDLPLDKSSYAQTSSKSRRTTVHSSRQPKNRAVATALGSELYDHIQQHSRSNVDVELLLLGAKKLANVYPVPGAHDRIAKLQQRAQQLETNIAHYESRLAEQRGELERISSTALPDDEVEATRTVSHEVISTAPTEDPQAISGDIDQLEQRKRALEDRVNGMDRDLNALAR